MIEQDLKEIVDFIDTNSPGSFRFSMEINKDIHKNGNWHVKLSGWRDPWGLKRAFCFVSTTNPDLSTAIQQVKSKAKIALEEYPKNEK